MRSNDRWRSVMDDGAAAREFVEPRRPQRFPAGTHEMVPIRDLDTQRLVEDDVAEIAHDLKSPLGAIALEATLLDDRIVHSDRINGLRSVMRIQQNVAFLDRLVQDLLDVCAMNNGNFKLRRAPVELRALVEQVVERCAGPARARVFIDAPQPVDLDVDELRIERVLGNLLDNAIKYAPQSTAIIVSVAVEDHRVCVSVIDAGPGIAAADLPFVFDRYRRAVGSQASAGCGLGLYVSKKIVEAHGGTIGVESAPAAGSRFHFELPR
jgi:signal transduction histidine kinase